MLFPHMSSRWQHRAVCIHPSPLQQGSPAQLAVLSDSGVWPLPFCKAYLDYKASLSFILLYTRFFLVDSLA